MYEFIENFKLQIFIERTTTKCRVYIYAYKYRLIEYHGGMFLKSKILIRNSGSTQLVANMLSSRVSVSKLERESRFWLNFAPKTPIFLMIQSVTCGNFIIVTRQTKNIVSSFKIHREYFFFK